VLLTQTIKKRFSFNHDYTKIRASQGHRVETDLNYSKKRPPATLYHGTAEKLFLSILKSGLQKMNRHHVYLSQMPKQHQMLENDMVNR
jgi:putative RNA 2'-phosphotransferase